jgi:mono/diheme cytochrome c family protein
MRVVPACLAAAAVFVLTANPAAADAVAAAPVPQAQKETANPVAATPESIKEGARVYAVWCRSCHGLRARGDGITAPPGTKPANLTDAEWKHGGTDAAIFKTIREGIAPFEVMKPQKGNISDTDIWNIVNYLRSLAQVNKK